MRGYQTYESDYADKSHYRCRHYGKDCEDDHPERLRVDPEAFRTRIPRCKKIQFRRYQQHEYGADDGYDGHGRDIVPVDILQRTYLPQVCLLKFFGGRPYQKQSAGRIEQVRHRHPCQYECGGRRMRESGYQYDDRGGDHSEYECVEHQAVHPDAGAESESQYDRYGHPEYGSGRYSRRVWVCKGVLDRGLHRGATDCQTCSCYDTHDYAGESDVPYRIVVIERLGTLGRDVPRQVVPDYPVRLSEAYVPAAECQSHPRYYEY